MFTRTQESNAVATLLKHQWYHKEIRKYQKHVLTLHLLKVE